MKILFYDGDVFNFYWQCLESGNNYDTDMNDVACIIDAANGPSSNIEDLNAYSKYNNKTILTNSILALNHDYGWDEENNRSNIYLWREQYHDFINIEELTEKEICRAHNIAKMYIAGHFEEEKVIENYKELCESLARIEN